MKMTVARLLNIVLVMLMALMVMVNVTSSSLPYDSWSDINDDGKIDIKDIGDVAARYGSYGTPINKTDLLLELQAKIDSLNATVMELVATVNSLNNTVIFLNETVVYLNSTGLGGRTYDSGWFAVGKNIDYDLTHNLGTTSLIVSLWFSKTNDGSDRCYGPAPLSWREHNPEHVSGVTVAEITSSMIRVRTGNDFRIPKATPGGDAYDNLSSGYVRVIALAIE